MHLKYPQNTLRVVKYVIPSYSGCQDLLSFGLFSHCAAIDSKNAWFILLQCKKYNV